MAQVEVVLGLKLRADITTERKKPAYFFAPTVAIF